MSTVNRSRQPRGVPVGGQFATETRAEAGAVALDARPDWGDLDICEGARTPWGPADHVRDLGPGAVLVGTPSHGGIKLSPERNRAVPAPLRSSSGWYEEDCEAHIVAFAHPDLGLASPEDAARGVRDWYPDGYEQVTGETIAPGQSWVKDDRLFAQAHQDDLVTVSAITSEDHPGMVEVTATVGGQRTQEAFDQERTFLVPSEEYNARVGRHPMVIDPARYTDVTRPKAPKTPLPRFTGINPAGLTSAQRSRLRAALGKRWRASDGTVRTLEDVITQEGLSGKSVTVEGGRRIHHLQQRQHAEDSSYSVLPVPKAVWDAVDAPDTRTPVDVAREEMKLAENALERARERGGSISARVNAQENARAARAAYEQALKGA